jgi:hypothetical protein
MTLLLLHDIRSVVAEKDPRYAAVLSDKGPSLLPLAQWFFPLLDAACPLRLPRRRGKEALVLIETADAFPSQIVFHMYNALKSHILGKTDYLRNGFLSGLLGGLYTPEICLCLIPKNIEIFAKIPFISAAD